MSIDRIELPGGVSPSGEATVADKALSVSVCVCMCVCVCVSHERVLAGSLFMNEDYLVIAH